MVDCARLNAIRPTAMTNFNEKRDVNRTASLVTEQRDEIREYLAAARDANHRGDPDRARMYRGLVAELRQEG